MILVTGHVDLDPGQVEAFLAAIARLSPAGRPGSGCLFYSVTVADPLAARVRVVELWQSHAALAAHLQHPATAAFLQTWAGRMQGDVRTYDATNERPLPG